MLYVYVYLLPSLILFDNHSPSPFHTKPQSNYCHCHFRFTLITTMKTVAVSDLRTGIYKAMFSNVDLAKHLRAYI